MMKHIAVITATIFLAGCSHQAPVPQGETHSTGGNFMPMYLDMISGKTPPKDTCEAHTLEELMMPCDKKDG